MKNYSATKHASITDQGPRVFTDLAEMAYQEFLERNEHADTPLARALWFTYGERR